MRSALFVCLALAWLVNAAPVPAQVTAAPPSRTGPVCVVAVQEDISHNTLFLIRRALREANSRRAPALVLDMDTNGGRVDATEEIIRALQTSPVPVYVYVNTKAYSAGAFISAATKQIYMAPGSVIGAATPVLMIPGGSGGPSELPKSYEEKISSAMRALIRATAQRNGHNPDVFEAMVDADRELVIDGTVISEKGKLLTLTDSEAARTFGDPPRPLLSIATVDTLGGVLDQLGLAGAGSFRVEPYGFEVLGRWITMISPLLIMVGIIAVYIELQHPGIGLPALVAVVAFGLYLLGHFVAGLAGMEEAVLFGIGVILLLVEVFILPGFGVTGVLGVAAILAALLLAMVPASPDSLPGLPTLPQMNWPAWRIPLLKFGGAIAGSAVALALLARYFPRSALFRRMELSAATSAAAGYTSSRGADRDLVGAHGVAETMLRPSGKGRFGDRLTDVITRGEHIEKGTAIEVLQVDGSRVLVRATSR